jgi:hypothetical protein
MKEEFDTKKPDDADGDAEYEPAEEFPDGELKENAANILAENMLCQVDHEGHNILGTLTNVSAREPVPQPDANYADQNWHPGGHLNFIN